MATDVQICNLALTAVGANTLLSLGDNTNEGRLCTIFYPLYRDYLLRLHPWNFLQTRASLAQLSTVPAFGFDFAFQLPSDCLRVTETDMTVHDEWRVEGKTIVCNVSTVNIVYNKAVTDPTLFDPLFEVALAFLIAWKLSKVLTGKQNFTKQLEEEYTQHMNIARTIDGMEGTPAVINSTELIDIRQANLVQDRDRNAL